MASRNAALKALLVSSLLVQGGAFEDFHCCYCDCYINCMRSKHRPNVIEHEHCQLCCLNKKDCLPFLNCGEVIVNCGQATDDHSCKLSNLDDLVSGGMGGVAVAAGGGGLNKSNGAATGAAAAPSA